MAIPTRKLCVSPYHKGSRWLLACYFYRSKRASTGLQSYCQTCCKIALRAENTSDGLKLKRNEYHRKYREKQRRENNVPVRAGTLKNPRFDTQKLYTYLKQWLSEEKVNEGKTSATRILLNGLPLNNTDQRYLLHLKHGRNELTDLKRVDRLANKYDLPLWEMVEAAGRYKRDVRTARRIRRAKRPS
jgi:hypothetical protein